MQKYIGTAIKKDVNNPLPAGETPAVGASVTVRLQSTNAIATIYSDNGVTTISQPLITDSGGRYEFYAANDRYKIEYNYNGATTTIEDVSLFDINDAAIQNLTKATISQAQAGTDDSAYATPLKVKAYTDQFGIGKNDPSTVIDFNTLGESGTGFYRTLGGTLNTPFGIIHSTVLNAKRAGAGAGELDGSQFVIGDTGSGTPIVAFRFGYDLAASAVPFFALLGDHNLLNTQNLSGGTITNNGTVAGSSLSPAQTGTWRNVSGNDITNNAYGLFRRV